MAITRVSATLLLITALGLGSCASTEDRQRITGINVAKVLAAATTSSLELGAEYALKAAAFEPIGSDDHSYFLGRAAVYFSGSGKYGPAIRAVTECVTTAKVLARKDYCERVKADFSKGNYYSKEAAEASALEEQRQLSQRRDSESRDEHASENERPNQAPAVFPSLVLVPPGAGLNSPGAHKARTSPNKNWCVATTIKRTSDGMPLWEFRNNCPTAVKIGWCDLDRSGNCLDIGTKGNNNLRPGEVHQSRSLSRDAVGPRYLACSINSAGYNLDTRGSNWYCSSEQ